MGFLNDFLHSEMGQCLAGLGAICVMLAAFKGFELFMRWVESWGEDK